MSLLSFSLNIHRLYRSKTILGEWVLKSTKVCTFTGTYTHAHTHSPSLTHTSEGTHPAAADLSPPSPPLFSRKPFASQRFITMSLILGNRRALSAGRERRGGERGGEGRRISERRRIKERGRREGRFTATNSPAIHFLTLWSRPSVFVLTTKQALWRGFLCGAAIKHQGRVWDIHTHTRTRTHSTASAHQTASLRISHARLLTNLFLINGEL